MVVSNLCVDVDRLVAGVDESEASRPISRLHHSGTKARLADQRRLLISGDSTDGDRDAEMFGRRLAEFGGAILNLGQHRPRDPEEREKLVVPGAGMDIEQQRPRGVGGVGDVNLAVGQAPDEKAVDGAEGQVSAFRFSARAGNIVENPGDLRRREIGVEQQAGALGHERLASALLEFGAKRRRSAVLPDDRIVDRPAGRPAPDQRRFALVGYPEPGERARLDAGPGESLPRCRERGSPQRFRVVLDPASLEERFAGTPPAPSRRARRPAQK